MRLLGRRAGPLGLGLALAVAAGCNEPEPVPVYQAVPVAQRDIVVSAQAAGTIQPDTVVEVKSRASGEIIDLQVETGQVVERGALMVVVDSRNPRNTMAQAEADLEVARARLANATSQRHRSEELFKSQSITEQEYESAQLDFANARADVVRAEVAVENAQDALDDTRVRAPISGTVIEKSVERGTVISSPTQDVSGGTVLLKMADLNLVQVRTLVDETDIGKIQPGMAATVLVNAYPNRPFNGEVLKIEPLAQTEQNVTMFPVLVRIENRAGLLRPGMNAEVEIHVGRREDVLAVPNAALRTPRDVGSAAAVLGLSLDNVQRQLAAATDSAGSQASLGARRPRAVNDSTPDSGGVPERRLVRPAMRRMGPRPGGAVSPTGVFGGRYVVFVQRPEGPTPVWVRTGLTDLDYSEVVAGLAPGDSVLLLPSTSLIQSQQEMQERMNRITGGAVPGMRQQGGGG